LAGQFKNNLLESASFHHSRLQSPALLTQPSKKIKIDQLKLIHMPQYRNGIILYFIIPLKIKIVPNIHYE